MGKLSEEEKRLRATARRRRWKLEHPGRDQDADKRRYANNPSKKNQEYVRAKHRKWVADNRVNHRTRVREYNKMKRSTDVLL